MLITYTVTNRSRDRISWIRIGAGKTETTSIVPDQFPQILAGRGGWNGVVVVPEETSVFHLWWENRYAILYRIHDAKRPDTRARRILKFVAMLNAGKTIH